MGYWFRRFYGDAIRSKLPLEPGDIGVQLTEGMMMEPEASVSAIVFHHPDCAYFTADEGETVLSV